MLAAWYGRTDLRLIGIFSVIFRNERRKHKQQWRYTCKLSLNFSLYYVMVQDQNLWTGIRFWSKYVICNYLWNLVYIVTYVRPEALKSTRFWTKYLNVNRLWNLACIAISLIKPVKKQWFRNCSYGSEFPLKFRIPTQRNMNEKKMCARARFRKSERGKFCAIK